MIKVETLHDLLNTRDEDVKRLDTEQLRILVGIARYFTRVLEREINSRDSLAHID